jgi:hypothetical protein
MTYMIRYLNEKLLARTLIDELTQIIATCYVFLVAAWNLWMLLTA